MPPLAGHRRALDEFPGGPHKFGCRCRDGNLGQCARDRHVAAEQVDESFDDRIDSGFFKPCGTGVI
jgi:hypothetical protein